MSRIALVGDFDISRQVGGVENVVRNLISFLEEHSHDTRLFGFHGGAGHDGILDGVAGRAFTRVLRNRHVAGVCAAVEAFDPDVVWQHDLFANWLAVRRLSSRFPAVLTNHSAELLKLGGVPFSDAITERLLAHFELVIAPSRELANVPARRSLFIPNGVDLTIFNGSAASADRAKLAYSLYGHGGPVVFCPRRWAPTKGVDIFVDSMAHVDVDQGVGGVLFVFAGDVETDYPKFARSIRNALETSSAKIVRLGSLEPSDLAQHYRAATVVVFPSREEAVSLGWLEASACGAASVVTDVGGFRDVAIDGINAVVIPPNDAAELAAGVLRLLGSVALRESLGRRSQETANSLNWQTVFESTIREIEIAVSRRKV